MNHVDLFSGIGGFALAARWAGIQTVQFVEIDPFCQKVLQKNFPGVPIHDDIKTFHYSQNVADLCTGDSQSGDVSAQRRGQCSTKWKNSDNTSADRGCGDCITTPITGDKSRGDISGEEDDIKTFTYTTTFQDDQREPRELGGTKTNRKGVNTTIGIGNQHPFLLTGGFPCQPFSCAGKRKGTSDDRHLWPHMLRVIKEFNPRWVIAENVRGLTNIKNVVEQGGDAGMEDDSDNGGEDGISTSTLVCILDDLEQAGYSVQVFLIPACGVGACHKRDRLWIVAHSESKRGGGEPEKVCREKCRQVDELLSNTINTDCHAADSGNEGLPGCERPGSHEQGQTTHGSTPERNHAWDEPWIEAATRLCRVDARVSNRVDRLKALGNAIVPQVAFEIMKAILKVSNG